jgi:hypothetical protein
MRKAERLLNDFSAENETANNSTQSRKQFAEWDQDHAMAKERKETGKEPANRPVEAKEVSALQSKPVRAEQKHSRGIDIPF